MKDRWKLLNIENKFAFDRLVIAYSKPHRAYHNLNHIRHCLEELDKVKDKLKYPEDVELAIWYHDCIYDVKSPINEYQSAEYAIKELKERSKESLTRIHDYIMVTDHTFKVFDSDAKYIADIDLAILGRIDMYSKYMNLIRKEYVSTPLNVYCKGRVGVLTRFLKKDNIYHTDYFREKYEECARANITSEIMELIGKSRK